MASINVLPDDNLLQIFDFCVDQDRSQQFTHISEDMYAWQTLVHVCRRWRNILFGSPLRLNLALVCTEKTPARDTLDIWPAFPLVIWSNGHYGKDSDFSTEGVDNIIAVLEQSNRVCQISLRNINSHLEELLGALQEPFPELTHLRLSSYGGPVIPDSFLAGSSPRLQYISLDGIPFRGLPKLLLSATHLVHLFLQNIPHSGYISPETMATTLSALTSLETLTLEFQSPQSRPDHASRRPPPLRRSVLPVLTEFVFKGVSEYLEYLVARINVPRLGELYITFFNQIIFDTPQLMQFISRSPALRALEKAHVIFGNDDARVNISSPTHGGLCVKIRCRELDWQVSSLEQICTWSFSPLSALEVLYIHKDPNSLSYWQNNLENAIWLELLRPFPAVKDLYLCKEYAPRIIPSLQELVGRRATEVLPALQNIFLDELQPSGPVQEGIREFIAARQVTSHPIAVSLWENSQQEKNLRY